MSNADLFAQGSELEELERELGGRRPRTAPTYPAPQERPTATLLGVDFTTGMIQTSRWGALPLTEEALGIMAKIALDALQIALTRQLEAARDTFSEQLTAEYDRLGAGVVDRVITQMLQAGQAPEKLEKLENVSTPESEKLFRLVVDPETGEKRMVPMEVGTGRETGPAHPVERPKRTKRAKPAAVVKRKKADKSSTPGKQQPTVPAPPEETPAYIQMARDLGTGASEGSA